MFHEPLRKSFTEFRRKSGKTIAAIAKECGINVHTLYGFSASDQRLSLKKALQLYEYITRHSTQP